jgi:hypothetical protein
MKNSNSQKAIGPQIPEPTDKEIDETVEKIKSKYDIVISINDAAKYAKLYKELEWWFLVEKFSREPKSIPIEAVKEIREYFKRKDGRDLTIDEAHKKARIALDLTVVVEKKRILDEMKKIFDQYR